MPGPPQNLIKRVTAQEGLPVVDTSAPTLPSAAPAAPAAPAVPAAAPTTPAPQINFTDVSPKDFLVETGDSSLSPSPPPENPPPLTRTEIREVRQIDPQLADHIAGIQGSMQQLRSMLQELREENRQLRDEVAHYRQAAEEARNAPPPPLPDIDLSDADIDPKDMQAFDPSHVDAVNRLARHNAAKLARPLVERIKQLEAEQRRMAEATARETSEMKKRAFQAAVEAAVPDVRQIFADSDFKDRFSSQPLSPLTSETIGDRLLQEWSNQNLGAVLRILKEYKEDVTRRSKAPPVHTQPSISPKTAEEPAKQGWTADRKLKYSYFKQATREWSRRRIPQEKFEEIRAIYDDAERRGNIDYTR